MYLPYWSLLVIFSVVTSIIAFLWGYKSGQFSDQKRASYLALNEEYINSTARARRSVPAGEGRFAGIIFAVIFAVMMISCVITFLLAV